MMRIEINLKDIYGETAKLAEVPEYLDQAVKIAGNGNVISITGAAPVWLYLKVAHALHGKAKQLFYNSPVTGDVEIFNHSVD